MVLLDPTMPFPEPFPKGALLLVDKPLGWTSFDVVSKLRFGLSKRLGVKRVKIGHAGTLDPLATGLLLVCVGDYTKRIDSLQGMPKEYTGTITMGAVTASFDREHPIEATMPTAHLTPERLEAARQTQIGRVQQVPPQFSAIKVDGKRVYKHARKGQEVDIPARTVEISTFDLGPLRPVVLDGAAARIVSERGNPIWQYPDYEQGMQTDFRVVCSKGTYIRTLAADLGLALETGAYLSVLRRTAIGAFRVETAHDMPTWTQFLMRSTA